MRNIAYWTTLIVVALSMAMFIYACSGPNKSYPPKTMMTKKGSGNKCFTSAKKWRLELTSDRIGMVESTMKSKVFRVLTRDSSFVVKGQLLYILDDSEIWNKILLTNRRLRREMELAEIYGPGSKGSDDFLSAYMSSIRRIQELNDIRNALYRDLSKTRIRSPFTGTLGMSKVKLGDIVYPGSTLNEIFKYTEDRIGKQGSLTAIQGKDCAIPGI